MSQQKSATNFLSSTFSNPPPGILPNPLQNSNLIINHFFSNNLYNPNPIKTDENTLLTLMGSLHRQNQQLNNSNNNKSDLNNKNINLPIEVNNDEDDEDEEFLDKKRKINYSCPNCPHKDAPHYAKGMCSNCYHTKGRKKKPTKCPHKEKALYALGVCQNCYQMNYVKKQKKGKFSKKKFIKIEKNNDTKGTFKIIEEDDFSDDYEENEKKIKQKEGVKKISFLVNKM